MGLRLRTLFEVGFDLFNQGPRFQCANFEGRVHLRLDFFAFFFFPTAFGLADDFDFFAAFFDFLTAVFLVAFLADFLADFFAVFLGAFFAAFLAAFFGADFFRGGIITNGGIKGSDINPVSMVFSARDLSSSWSSSMIASKSDALMLVR